MLSQKLLHLEQASSKAKNILQFQVYECKQAQDLEYMLVARSLSKITSEGFCPLSPTHKTKET